ncbi:phosphoglycerate kinase [Patulibacter americanus]|uniref:phosphoglycerate kinase n=1 Tax=Patulibacter americanus TaxID=588672 RepID=UPI0003B59C1A|nr:phosphoglycerate kinase [Patulibacter americanus]
MSTDSASTTGGRAPIATLDGLAVAGKRVFVRVDFNVPLAGEPPADSNAPHEAITDDTRIRAAVPTLRRLLDEGAALVLAAHLGRPKGVDPDLSLAPVAARLMQLLEESVTLAPAVVGDEVTAAAAALEPGTKDRRILMLENVRYEAGETKNDETLAKAYAALCDGIFVNDAFGAAHRAHASTEGVARQVEHKAAGLLLQGEVETLEGILADPGRPLVAIVGGAKVTDKIGVIDAFLDRADTILIGGAMAFPFFKAQGHDIGSSLCEDEGVEPAARALRDAELKGCRLLLPSDLSLGREFSPDTEQRDLDGVDTPDGWMGLDIGPKTAQAYREEILSAGSVFWNGPMGAFELEPFAAGTRTVAEAVAETNATTVVGGGDSAAALQQFGLGDQVTHLSTGGGASLELIEGKTLPGVEVLRAP